MALWGIHHFGQHGTFLSGVGCESDLRVTFGKYFIRKNGNLRLKFLSLDSIVPIREIRETDQVTDSIVMFHLFDRQKKLVYSSFQIVLRDTADKFENLWLDDSGLIRINRFKYKELILAQLLLIYKEVAPIQITDKSMEIHFNLPNLFLHASQTSRGESKQQKLVVKKDGLYKSNRKQKLFEL